MVTQEDSGEIVVNVLSREKRLRVLGALVDGGSERAIERMTGVNRGTVSSLGLLLGAGAQRVHDRHVHDLSCSLVEVDEQWSYITKKQKRVVEGDPSEFGEAYSFVGLDAASRLVISFHVGKRDQANTDLFIDDLRSRLVVMPEIVSDGFKPYVTAIGQSFGPSINYAMTIKNFRGARRNGGDDHRYEPPREGWIIKTAVYGAPDLDRASTAYVERVNGTARNVIGRSSARRRRPGRRSATLPQCGVMTLRSSLPALRSFAK